MNFSSELIERGFIHQFTASNLEEIFNGEKKTIYQGIDPSADSAHVGNMVIWLLLRHLANDGHKIIFLVGGGTGMIGDPKPDSERELKAPDLVAANVAKIKQQAQNFITSQEVEFVNNYDWLGELKLIDFLRDIGKHFTVNDLIKKDAIATRLQSDTGLSYTEFAYPLLQGYDYLKLFTDKNATLQVGGSDQWGNLVAGVDLIRRKTGESVHALTVPLVIDKTTGKKFGKSEGNAVWLDAEKTSPYQFYQFWLNVSDEGVIDYLKLFTFISLEEIQKIKQEFELNPGSRLAQKKLAFAVTELVHGEESAKLVEEVSAILFGGKSVVNISELGKKVLLENAPTTKVKGGDLVIDVLVATNLATSKREARTFIESGAVAVNDNKVMSIDVVVTEADLHNGIAILRRGKKQLCVLEVEYQGKV
ncbi:tyrosine--tRNA ligase [Candidatus Nomurabacteria bacterium]|nr:tyrosine--tRNA ligase [Candidatus Kaiserbacteria bacterium]MCB9814507.1 tyrosine--tRNA ligase [Candidatus Nomurabacteria bacterium]